jgi:hypothetical protein
MKCRIVTVDNEIRRLREEPLRTEDLEELGSESRVNHHLVVGG